MGLARWHDIITDLVDPVTSERLTQDRFVWSDQHWEDTAGRLRFAGDQPLLLPPDVIAQTPPDFVGRSWIRRRGLHRAADLWRRSQRHSTTLPHEMLLRILDPGPSDVKRVLVVGGAEAGVGVRFLVESPFLQLISFDVYPSVHTTFIGDAHRIPMADGSVDAVWIQAVLEHVADPVRVVAEILRVLAPNGLVYAETPFLQPVHEGAFDFTRYTPSGHRLLFGAFEEVESGPLGGPAASTVLCARGVVGGLLRSHRAARIAAWTLAPLILLDRFVDVRWRRDYATGAYFLGQRGKVAPVDVRALYAGAQI